MRSLLLLFLCASTVVAADTRPNILFILTDDQDVVMSTTTSEVMPQLYSLIASQGINMTNTWATTPVCCPSRSSFITGRYIHSINVVNNTVEGNCSSPAFLNGPNQNNIGKLMNDAGYNTLYTGKWLNQYGFGNAPNNLETVPPGWDKWMTLQGNSRYYNYQVSDDGVAVKHGSDYLADYFTDLVSNTTIDFILNSTDDKPFFAVAAPPACHDPTDPAPQHAGKFSGRKAPRLPSYGGGFSSDRNWFVRTYGALGMPEDRQDVTDWQYMRRLETLQSVDDFVGRAVEALEKKGKLDNTYIFYTSDHGYHFGLLGLLKDKRMPYEFDTRIPGFVRGPGIPKNSVGSQVMTMVDFAPTFLDIAGAPIPSYMDGRSVLGALKSPSPTADRTFLIEFNGEAASLPGPVCADQWSEGVSSYIEGPEMTKFPPVFKGTTVCSTQDSANNTYVCSRTFNATDNTLFCKYDKEVPAPFYEYYDVASDFYQRKNQIDELTPDKRAALETQLDDLAHCTGASCIIKY